MAIKEVKKFKDGKKVSEMCESDGVKLAPASVTIEKYWYEIIKDVFNYEMRREAELQEVHKLYTDERVLAGLKLYKEGKVVEGAITDVDVRATVKGETSDYMVTMKKWKPLDKFDKPKLIRHRYEIEDYIASMFFDCSCQDHMIQHYKANSACACKHICAVMWKLMEEENMPKFFIKPVEAEKGYQKSNNIDLVKDLKGLPMKQFSQHLNVVALRDFRDTPTSLSYSIHRIPNLGYEKNYPEGLKPIWITFTNPEDVEKLIKANIRGYVEMLASRKNGHDEIVKSVKELFPAAIVEEKTKDDALKDRRLFELETENLKLKEAFEYIQLRADNQLRIHWKWLKDQPHEEVAKFVKAIIKNHGPEQSGEEIPDKKDDRETANVPTTPAGKKPTSEEVPTKKLPSLGQTTERKGWWGKVKSFFQGLWR